MRDGLIGLVLLEFIACVVAVAGVVLVYAAVLAPPWFFEDFIGALF